MPSLEPGLSVPYMNPATRESIERRKTEALATTLWTIIEAFKHFFNPKYKKKPFPKPLEDAIRVREGKPCKILAVSGDIDCDRDFEERIAVNSTIAKILGDEPGEDEVKVLFELLPRLETEVSNSTLQKRVVDSPVEAYFASLLPTGSRKSTIKYDPDEDDEDDDYDEPIDFRSIDALCTSSFFDLTPENFLLSGTGEFLKKYALDNHKTPAYQGYGLLGSLAKKFLKDQNFVCGMNTPHRCAPSCAEIVRMNPYDLYTARMVYFTFISAQHLAEASKALNDGISSAQVTVAQMAGEMAANFFWAPMEEGMADKLVKYTLGIIEMALGQLAMYMPQIMTAGEVSQFLFKGLEQGREEERHWGSALKMYSEAMNRNFEYRNMKKPDRQEEGMVTRLMGVTDHVDFLQRSFKAVVDSGGFVGRSGSQWSGMAVMTFLDYWRVKVESSMNSDRGGSENGFGGNQANLEAWVVATTDAARQSLMYTAEQMFESLDVQEDGTTMFSNVIYNGAFLPGNQYSTVGFYHSAGMEQKIKRAVMIKALNQALRSQRNYITCTKDYTITRKPHRPVSLLVKNFKPASSCQRDNNGPHDFKACVDGYVCYMYHWNDRGNQISWHIERPFGRAILEEQDWDIDIKDIITSSVRGHLLGTSENAHTILQEITAASDPTFSLTSIKKALDPSTPGLFNIPVCISDHNWATVVDGHHPPGKWVHNLDMTNTIKSLPCNCGLWGNDTKRVWQDLALWSPNKNFKSMTCINCNWQIFYRIKEPLEMYVAACRLEFKLPQLAFPFAKAGKHSECDTITRLIDASGSTPKQFTENYPEIYRALVCWLRIVPGHRSKFCSKYQQLTMPQLLDLAEQDMKDNRQYQKDFSERLKKWGKGKQVAGVETLDPLSLLDFAETNIMTMVPRTPKDDRQWEVLMEDFAQMRDELMIWESQANSNATLIEGHYPE